MRSLIVLILAWLTLQFGTLLLHRSDRHVSGSRPPSVRVDEVLRDWPERSRVLAKRVIAEYGIPDGADENTLWWDRLGGARIVIYSDGTHAQPGATGQPQAANF